MNYSEDPKSFQARSQRLVDQGSRPLGINLGQQTATWQTPRASDGEKGGPNQTLKGKPALTNQARTWPTATVGDSRQSGRHTTKTDVMHAGTTMTDAVRNWPTPMTSDDHPKNYLRGNPNLSQETTNWPTPATRDYKGANGPEHLAKTRGHHDQLPNAVVLSGLQAPTETGVESPPASSRLNPLFVEWLMGWPEDWSNPYGPTDYACSETELFPSKQKKRSGSSSTKSVRRTPDHSGQVTHAPQGGNDKDRYEQMANAKRRALLKKLSEADASGVGNNFKDGKYRLALKKVSLEEGFKGNRFQVVFTVMNAAKIRVVSPANPEGKPPKLEETYLDNVEPNPVGADVDWLQMLDENDSPGPGNVRRLFMDLFNKKEISNDDYLETLAEMCDLDEEGELLKQPLNLAKGMVIDMETLRIITKKKKIEIVVCKWSHVEQTEEEKQQVVQWLDQVTTHQKALAAGETAAA